MRKRTKRKQSVSAGFLFGGRYINPQECARLRCINRPLTDEEIDKLTYPIDEFIHHMKHGTATETHFRAMIEIGYNLLALLKLMYERKNLAKKHEQNDTIREEFYQVFKQTNEWLCELITSIRKRQEKTGRFGGTSEEYDKLAFINNNWRSMLELADYGDWFISLEMTYKRPKVLQKGSNNVEKE